MAAIASGAGILAGVFSPSSSSGVRARGYPISASSSSNPKLFRPNFRLDFTLKPYRLGISHRTKHVLKHQFRPPIVSCLEEDNSETYEESTTVSHDFPTIDLNLPRRSLLVKFTCNSCGSRSQKFINRLAYERGTVFVQCSGCLQHHKLVDNLGLVVEYDFREEIGVDSDADQV